MWGVSTQTVYVEYAFLENAFLDGILLFLALRYSGSKRRFLFWVALTLGGIGAVVYPLLNLPAFWGGAYKLALGVFLPLLASWREKASKTSFCIALFFVFSFLVAGGVFAWANFLPIEDGYFLSKIPTALLVAGTIAALCLLVETIKKSRRQKQLTDFLVDCEFLSFGVKAKGFIDTGNCARKRGIPVCFVSPMIFARLRNGQKITRVNIKTVSGGREIPLVKIKNLRITTGGQTHIIRWVYVSPNLALCGREYEMILGAWACAETDGSEGI